MERLLDLFFDYQEIRDGCEADSMDQSKPMYLKRYFIAMNDDPTRSAGVNHRARFSLTWRRKTPGVQVYLHHIMRSDLDRELHDHPWNFLSLMLWRGYVEETAIGWQRKLPGMLLFRRAEHRHRVLLTGWPAWSLVFTSGKKRSWGFWRDGDFIPWRQFIARKCEPTASVPQAPQGVP